ncbi:hypothetical protein PLESTB_001582500 [Pleodorina starrii]|uniref:Lipoxygenase n=1 Tax=Pleodorina starrii TaxID=330485 RepID=A0A9W6F925_9CHLO|nr:hypothetical protein PLESTM_000722500 [Pleodorina starrii]GLC60181.1 hypothetical protein PLESTB_001582500 [Pleodorina starrii]GLC66969.1 hypothetical protein PLESTF_000497200 [Pleodorina starrii]
MASVPAKCLGVGERAAQQQRATQPSARAAVVSGAPLRLPGQLGSSIVHNRRGQFQQRRQPTWRRNAVAGSSPGDEAGRTSSRSAADGSGGVTWKCTIRSTSPLLGDTSTRLSLVVIDTHSEVRSAVITVDSWKPPREVLTSDGTLAWERDGPVTLPAAIKDPGALLLRKMPEPNGAPAQDYIGSIQLVSATTVHTVPANSWVSSDHGWRVFFCGEAFLPKDTPPALADERRRELEELQGSPESRMEKRKNTDRIYWYQVYSDLSSGQTGKLVRPNLGGSKELPYPRRLATNRGNEPDGREKAPAKGEEFWLQMDDRFSFNKNVDFNGAALQSSLASALAIIAEVSGDRDRSPITLVPSLVLGGLGELLGSLFPRVESPLDNYEDYKDVLAMYKKASGPAFQSLLPSNLYPASASSSASSASSSSSGASTASTRGALGSLIGKVLSPFKKADGAWDFQLPDEVAAKIDASTADQRVGPVYDSATGAPAPASRSFINFDSKPGAARTDERLGSKLWSTVTSSTTSINNLLFFNVPRVLEGRADAWYTDEEYGRQIVAGFNPCTIAALKDLPENFGSAIRGKHVNADLQGATLEQLVDAAKKGAKPRLFMVDYWDLSAFWQAAEAEAAAAGGSSSSKSLLGSLAGGKDKDSAKPMVQHAGRAVFYLRQDANGKDTGLIPVAIELAHPKTHKENPGLPRTAGVVYSRADLVKDPATLAVWRLAKMVFRSLDSSFHQLISHWNRTHSVLEPFFIAMRRNISVMHPVYKLMAPHYRYTLNINRNARSSLINAGGVIEKTFSAGPYALRLASVVYGKYWNFATEALPEDLKARGMVDPSTGKPWLDYPYATDGLDMWSALTAYFDKYLRLYYSSDKDVLEDTELQAWWAEVKTEGHPDLLRFGLRSSEEQLWGFQGPIPSVSRLVTVLTTLAWLASGHHAAVNFGQYDFTSFILNTSSLVRKPMPAPGDAAYKELTGARSREKQEGIILEYLADPITATTVSATVKLLSAHARDEHTLDEENEMLVDPAAREANQEFIAAMKRLECDIEMRNADAANWARYGLANDKSGPMPYTLLTPGSRAGVTMRGVPYSVSI